MRILNNLDLRQNQLLQAVVHNLAAAPESPVKGQIYFNTVDNKFYGYGANGWVDLSYSFDDGDIQSTLDSLQEQITAEISRATTKEGELDKAIKANATAISELQSTVSTLDSDLDAEVLRATAKEEELHTAIEAEVTRATGEETKIRTEFAEADKALKTALEAAIAEKADRTYVDSQLSTKVDSSKIGNGANQIPMLDASGKLNMSTIPTLAVNETQVVEDIDAALALNQKSGDIVIININSEQVKAITAKYAADQQNIAQGYQVLESNVLSDEFAAYLAEGKTTYICVDPSAETFQERYRPLNSIADTMTRGEIEKELAKKDSIESVNVKVQGAKDYADSQIASAKSELTGAINSAKSELEQSISTLDGRVDAVETKATENAGEITAIKEAATQLESKVDTHIADAVKHITAEERQAWNAKTDKKTFLIGDNAAKEFEIAHGLDSEDVVVSVKDVATKEMVFTDVKVKDANTIVVSFGMVPAVNEFKVVVIG